jgi:hypothetical protein
MGAYLHTGGESTVGIDKPGKVSFQADVSNRGIPEFVSIFRKVEQILISGDENSSVGK